MQHLPLFWVKFDLTWLVLKTLSQSADAIDKNDRSNTDGMPPANTLPRKPNNSLFNGSTLWWGLWCIGQSSAHTPQRSSPFLSLRNIHKDQLGLRYSSLDEDKDGGVRERRKDGKSEWKGGRKMWNSIYSERKSILYWYRHVLSRLTHSLSNDVTKTQILGGPNPQLFSWRIKGALCNII